MDESGTDDVECPRKVGSEGKVAGAIRFLANARGLQLECARLSHMPLPVTVLFYGSENDMERKG